MKKEHPICYKVICVICVLCPDGKVIVACKVGLIEVLVMAGFGSLCWQNIIGGEE